MKQPLLLSSVIKTGSAKEIAQWESALKAQAWRPELHLNNRSGSIMICDKKSAIGEILVLHHSGKNKRVPSLKQGRRREPTPEMLSFGLCVCIMHTHLHRQSTNKNHKNEKDLRETSLFCSSWGIVQVKLQQKGLSM